MTLFKSPNAQRLWDSLELHVMRRDSLLVTLVIAIFCMFAACDAGRDAGAAAFLVTVLICMIPFWGFYLWRTFQIFRKAEDYIFCRCKLSQPHQNFWLKSMYFTVMLESPDGRTLVRDTHAIFQCHGIVEPLIENYVNSTVTIAYNPETEMVVVIG